jgi:hypothetical protein
MQAEDRCRGDYMQWDYSLATPEIDRVFRMAATAFHDRNFGPDALANTLMGTRFDIEVCRHFHPDLFEPEWLAEGIALNTDLTRDSVAVLRRIVARVRDPDAPANRDLNFARALIPSLQRMDRRIRTRARALAARVLGAIGQGAPLTELGDRVATPLQRAVAEIA